MGEGRPRQELARGARYLELATTLLRQIRREAATGGIWEAADVQWWFRTERATDAAGQLFWLDAYDQPVAAVLRADFGGAVQCDVLALPGRPEDGRMAWQQALRGASAAVEYPVRDDDAIGTLALREAGWLPSGENLVSSWMAAEDRPRIPALPPGYRLMSRASAGDRTHHLVARNGPDVAERLGRCSLYQPELDLMVEAPDGRVAGYGLFWADPVTHVGLVEPMRTEDEFQQRGIASHVLAAGLDLLAARGCDRLKVSSDRGLYLRAGFRPLTTAAATAYCQPSEQASRPDCCAPDRS